MSHHFQPSDEFIELLQGVIDGELTPDGCIPHIVA